MKSVIEARLLVTIVDFGIHDEIVTETLFNMCSLQETPNFINVIYSDFIKQKTKKDPKLIFLVFCF